MRSQTAAIKLAAASAVSIAAAQTPASTLTLTATPVVLDAARRVLVTSAAAGDNAKTLTIVGTDRNGNLLQEAVTITGAGTIATSQDFATVASATIGVAAAGNISLGTNGVGSTRWIKLDDRLAPFSLGVAVNLGGVTSSVTVEVTLDEVDRAIVDALPTAPAWTVPVAFAATNLATLATDTLGAISTPCRAIRLTVLSGAATTGPRLTVIQAGPT